MTQKELRQTQQELKAIELLYQETIDLAKSDQVLYKELKGKLAQIKLLFQKCCKKYKEAAIVYSISIDFKDEELYEYWTIYRTSFSIWRKDWTPKIQAFLNEKKPYTLEFLDELLVFLNKIKEEAETFIKQYELLKEELSPAMSPKFSTWKEQTKNKLNDPKQGWVEYIQHFSKIKEQRLRDNALSEKINALITLYKELVQLWRDESRPNCNALLVTEENVANTQKLYDNMQALKTLLEEAPKEFKTAYAEWYQKSLREEWGIHLQTIKKGLEDSNTRKASMLIKGNPELKTIENRDLKYIDPHKKIGLYKQGKRDEHKIEANDVQQGILEDCFVLSPIAALAKTNPKAIEQLIEEKADGSFEVTLYLRKDPKSLERTKEKIKVKREFVVDQYGKDVFAGKGDRELWVQVLEKAIATARGGYDGIDKGAADEVLQLLTGKQVNMADFKTNDLDLLWGDLLNAYKNKKATNFSSLLKPNNIEDLFYKTEDEQKIYYEHNYYLDKIDANNIWLNNPHGKEHLVLTKKDLEKYFARYYILD
ncbi:C2 family cysteine protease [Aureispira anguillae]|uniref:C2 family cysteine protease n=1 Tax=Aureispira anguillae TaxID=2864201 RepID=A0A915YGN2_9BACT|nr:C2 family cysteine protease [Aureispira anguillae]BDS12618.1 C2 family cysteine protease [Aureispira anguillae]